MDVPPPPDVFQILVTYKICFQLNNKKYLLSIAQGSVGETDRKYACHAQSLFDCCL